MTARDRTILMVVAALAAVAAFWFLALKPKRAEIGVLDGQIATQTQRLQTAQTTVAAGLAAKAAYPRDYATVTELGKALPADDDLPSLLYQLDAASHGTHIEFDSIQRATGGSSGTSAGSGSTTSGSSSATGAATGAATSAAALPPGATVGAAGLATLPFTFTFTGSFFDLQRFLAGVHGFVRSTDSGVAVRGRLLTVNGVSLVPGAKGLAHIEAKIAATAYLAPSATQSAAAPSTSGTGSGTSTAPAPTSSAITGGSN
jgi:Tfp pilus assembly protein PilO